MSVNPVPASYADLFLRWRDASRILLTCDDDVLSYADCVTRGERLARALCGAGIERPARIAAMMPNGPEFVISLYACARIGVTLVPISTWSKPAEIARILRDAQVELILAKNSVANEDVMSSLLSACVGDDELRGSKIYEWAESSAANPIAELLANEGDCDEARWQRSTSGASHADADLVVLYTSGSTGLPKGVILRQSSVARNGAAIAGRMGFGESDRIFSYFPLFFSGGLCNSLTGVLASGAELVTQAKFNPSAALRLIRARRCTGRNVWHDGLEPIAALPEFNREDLRGMRRGLQIDPEFCRRLGLPPDEGVNMYGMTETATAFTCGDFREPAALRQTTHGRPFPDTQLRVVTPGTSTPLGAGAEGEICVRGYNLMRGYTDGSEADLIDEDGFFHTGDIGYLDDNGYLRFSGRRKTLIKVKGLTVQPEEVEAVLLKHPGVLKVVVAGIGEGHESTGVVALVVIHADSQASASEIEAFGRSELSSYKAPRVIVIEERLFPVSASLKINRVEAARLLNSMLSEREERGEA